MFFNRRVNLQVDMNLDDDKEEEEEDENRDLREFYKSNLHLFFNCPMTLIGYKVTRQIALKIAATNIYDDDWREYAAAMGMDNETIIEIMVGARCRKEQAVFIAMDRIVSKFGKFGHIIVALLKTRRYDVLKAIESFVRNDLLLKISSCNSVSSTPCKDESNRKDPSIPSACSMTCKDETCTEEHCIIKKHSAPFSAQKRELNFFQQRSVKGYFKSGLQISNSLKLPGESLEEIPFPSAPEEEKITVLIPHTESKRGIAEELSLEFSQNGILATTLTEVNDWLNFGREIVLDAVFKEVDFIVPIVCSEFLEEISPRNRDQREESDYAMNNMYLHTLIMDEYSSNKYINLRVRPVIVPEMDRRSIREIIYKFSFKLPEEVPKLIQVLKETNDIKNTMVHQINK